MEEWKLKEICELIVDCPHSTAKNEGYGYPLIRTPNVGKGRLLLQGVHRVNDEVYNARNERAVPSEGDIILAREAPVGNAAIIMPGQKVCLGQRVVLIRANKSMVNPMFLVYYLLSDEIQHRLKNNANGAVVAHLNMEEIRNLKVSIPDIKIQNSVAGILSSLDDKIECNRRINDNFAFSFLLLTCFVLWLLKLRNDNLEQQAQALFKSWLSHCSKMVTIGDLSLNITDYTKCEREEVVLINSSDVTEGHFEHHILSENKNLKGHFKKRFQKGDILYSQVRPRNRHWAFCTFDSDNYLASTQLMVIRNRPNVIPSILLYQYIIDDNVWLEFTLKTETRSGTFPQGNYEDLSSIRVPFGADTQSISASLERIYNLIYYNEDESRHLAQLRDTLLPRLMSGELKVNEIERTVG